MRPLALVAVLLSAAALAAGCDELSEEGSSALPVETIQPADVDIVSASFVPPEQVDSCVEQMEFGAYTGDAIWSQVWSDVGETEDGATAYCSQVGADDPAKLLAIHDGWLQTEAFLAASAEPDAAPSPPATTERPPDIAPGGPDLNCPDVGRKVWVGSNDYHELDANGDGWGCDSYG